MDGDGQAIVLDAVSKQFGGQAAVNDVSLAISLCCRNRLSTCALSGRIQISGRLGSTEAMACVSCATGRFTPGLVTITMSCR